MVSTPRGAVRRVRFGETFTIQYERLETRKAAAASALHDDDERSNDCATANAGEQDTQDMKVEVRSSDASVAQFWSQGVRNTHLNTSAWSAATDERCKGGVDDEVQSLVDAITRFDSAKTKSRSLVPRFEKHVELDCTRSTMWMRRRS
eukprot:TRINITY_DN50996_c0_g1_i1.p1 TRINITY_DN50996_c0_g1~~TRINITY_DN50996_c0_g1_i1.p1  ORF type:complete len:148 (+),score=27.30 TRINITY_DN50996_c0_g1_i1:48-491(+)